MRAVRARRARARVAIFVMSIVAAGGLAAAANAATVAVGSTTTNPEQAVPVQLSLTGAADPGATSDLEAVVRPSGGLACQPDFASDLSATGNADTVLFGVDSEVVAPGPYAITTSYKPPTPGGYQVCAWLSQPPVSGGSGTTGPIVTGPATTSFTAAPPQVSQLALAVPSSLSPGDLFQLTYTTQTDQQLSLLSVIAQAGGPACAGSYELQQQESRPGSTVVGPGDQQVFGGPASTTVTTRQKAGSYVICTWLEGPNYGEVDDALSTPLTVGTPTHAAKPAKLGLRLGAISASHRHGLSVAGTTAAAFTGRLTVAAHCGSSARTARRAVRKGRFSVHLALPGGCRSDRRVTVKISWGGSSAFAKSSASRSVAIKR